MQSYNLTNTNSNLAEVIAMIVNVDEQAVDDKLTRLNETHQLINMLDCEEIDQEIDCNVYCNKTGQLLRTWDEADISYLVQTVGKKRAKEVIKIKSKNQIADQWLFTDGEALEQLSDNDPVGYFVYAMNKVLVSFDPVVQLIGQPREAEAFEKLHENRIVTYKHAAEMPLNLLIRVNEIMRRFLSITQSKAAYNHLAIPQTDMKLASETVSTIEEFEQGVQETIANLIRYEFKRGRLKNNLTYQEVMDLKLHYKGHSNFRNQKKLKVMTETEHVAFLLEDFMPNLTPFQVQMKAGSAPEMQSGVKLKTHTGELQLNLTETKVEKTGIKLTFAQLLKKR